MNNLFNSHLRFCRQTGVQLAIFLQLVSSFGIAQTPDTLCARRYEFQSDSLKNKERLEEALISSTNAIKCWNTNGDLWVKRASVRNMLSDFKGAKDDIDTASSLGVKSSYFYQTKGINEYGRGKIKISIESFSKAIGLNPRDEVSYYYIIGLLASIQNYKDALYYTNRAYLNFDPDPQLLIQKSAICLALKQYDAVIEPCSVYLKHPGDDEAFAYCYRGIAYVRLGKIDEGISDLTKSVGLNSKMSAPFLYLGIAFKEKGDFRKARICFDQAIKNGPDISENYWEYASMEQLFTERPDFAVSLLDKYREHLGNEPLNNLYYLYLANCYNQLGDTLKTLEIFRNGFETDTANTFQLHFYRLGTFIGNNKYLDLQLNDIDYLIASNRIDPNEISEFYTLKGFILMLADEKSKLHDALAKALENAPQSRKHVATYNLAMYELFFGEKFGKTDKALKYLDESIKFKPTLEAYFAKAFLAIQFDKNGFEEASSILSEAKRHFSDDQSKLSMIQKVESSFKTTSPFLSHTLIESQENQFIYYLLPEGKLVSSLLLAFDSEYTTVPPAVERFFQRLTE